MRLIHFLSAEAQRRRDRGENFSAAFHSPFGDIPLRSLRLCGSALKIERSCMDTAERSGGGRTGEAQSKDLSLSPFGRPAAEEVLAHGPATACPVRRRLGGPSLARSSTHPTTAFPISQKSARRSAQDD